MIDFWIFAKGVEGAGRDTHVPDFGVIGIGGTNDSVMLGQSPFCLLKGAPAIPAERGPTTATPRLISPISIGSMELERMAIAESTLRDP